MKCLMSALVLLLSLSSPVFGGYIIPNGTVTNAKLANNAVTGAKIASSTITGTQIATGTLTQALLASRATGTSVAAGGVARSGSSGAGSGSWLSTSVGSGLTAITGLSVTIVTTGRPVMVMAASDTTGSYGEFITASSNGLYLSWNRDSGTYFGAVEIFPPGTGTPGMPASAVNAIDFPPAGTHTYALYGAMDSGGTLHPVSNVSIIAFEL